ncbi:MAG: hypothetical protein IKG04_01385 [Exiguobacterium sp.]|nr:hypothetical protein [Exiguobacterium sp.]
MKAAIVAAVFLIVGMNLGYLLGAYITYKMLASNVEEGDIDHVKRD